MIKYAIVAFTGEEQEDAEETIAVVPVKWIDKLHDDITDIFWPPKRWPEKGSRAIHLKRAIKNCIEPDIHWPLLKGSVLHLYHEYDYAIKGLKKAEDNTSLETEADDAPRRKKLPRRYIDSDGDNEDDEENNMPTKKKGRCKRKVTKLSESDDESGSKTLPRINSDILNAVKENSIHVLKENNMKNKVRREKALRRQSLEDCTRLRILQEFPNYSKSQSQGDKQKQQKKVHSSQFGNDVRKNHNEKRKMDHTNRKNFMSVRMPSENSAATFFNSKMSSVPSPIKEKVANDKKSKTSEIHKTSTHNLSISAPDVASSDISLQDHTESSFPFSTEINSSDKGLSCLSQNSQCSLVHTITCGTRSEACSYSSPDSETNQNGILLEKKSDEETKMQLEPSYSFKSKGNFTCKQCHNEIMLNSTVLLEVSKKLDSVLINQAIIMRSVNPDYAKSMTPFHIPNIPLKTREDFQNMEIFLAANRINFEAVRDLLHSKCASALSTFVPSERSITGNILSKLISNSLAKLITWSGSEGNKIKFSETKQCEIVFCAVKLRFPDSFLTDAEAKIKRWFQTANGRRVSESHDSDA
ncbi:uncharacterized protein LOC116852462 isoform X3 [Odontomachus brunneus]|uniref:uncharacterized protein LOC116852462 isoform X3 n=1 Tax=Odontomachus brunneus TaxID=486640 RepID=UPI0013F1E122|nr:uncharacterized protein LOC116852462 isoform X3 [Odontomachus brunneus]